MIVSSRIKTIGNFIKKSDIVADIGADHGLLELYLLAKYGRFNILAIENKTGPYSILDQNLRSFKDIRLSLSDGLTAVDVTIDTVVIAGMGGLNIKNILDAHPGKVTKLKKFVIDAHRDIPLVRKTLFSYGYELKKEKIVHEFNKFYVISVFENKHKVRRHNKDEIEIGHKLYNDELWPLYKEYLINENNKTIAKIIKNPKMQDKVLELEKANERIKRYGKN